MELRTKLSQFGDERPLRILAYVVPGGGKSRLPGIMAEAFPNYKIGWFVPRSHLRTQGVLDVAKEFNIELRDSANDIDPSRQTRGFVTTYQSLSNDVDLWRHEFLRHKYIAVVDECHHAKEYGSERKCNEYATGLRHLRADIWLNMTGTLKTNDGGYIHGMSYAETSKGMVIDPTASASHPDLYIRYNRQLALIEKAIVPIKFFHYDGEIKWDDGKIQERRLSEVEREEESAAIWTALQTELAMQLFDSGLDHFKKYGRKLIVVTSTQVEARRYAKILQQRGIETALAITDEGDDAKQAIQDFRFNDSCQALTTCAMAYEGLDCPVATHLICLTRIRSEPWIEQMLGRIWRFAKGKTQCFAFVPDDPRMERVLAGIQAEQLQVLREKEGGNGGGTPSGVVPLALTGNVDVVTESVFDGHIVVDEQEIKFRRILAEIYHTDVNDPRLEEHLELYRRQQSMMPATPPRTPAEQEKSLRDQIADFCRKADTEYYGKVWGTAQGRLQIITGKSITIMTREELQQAHRIARSQWPKVRTEYVTTSI